MDYRHRQKVNGFGIGIAEKEKKLPVTGTGSSFLVCVWLNLLAAPLISHDDAADNAIVALLDVMHRGVSTDFDPGAHFILL